MIPIIDTHQHLWDFAVLRPPWLKEGPLARSHTMEDYLRLTEGLGVVKTVYMEVAADPRQHDTEAEYVIGLCRRDDNPMCAAVIGGEPASPGFEAYVERFARSPYVKGVRQTLHGGTPAGFCLRPEFVRGIRVLGRHGLSFDICLRPGELLDGAKLADQCPETRFVLDHCGNANVQAADRTQWERDMTEVAKRPNVVCKISGIVASARPGAWTAADLAPFVNHVRAAFGPDRIFFGSDWPVCTKAATIRQWVEALREISAPWGESEQRRLFHDNARAFFRLP